MRIIIAPAKKMVVDTDSFAVDDLPQFLERTERLKTVLQGMSPKDLQDLWKCNDAIARLNVERLEQMDLRRNLTPAILSYEGIQYRYMAPGVMETAHLDYLREHLRILSGFYGLLRPFDGVPPGELKDGKVVEKGTKCKMARGQMVRWLAENQIKSRSDLRAFDQLGYQFCRSISVRNHTVFLWIQSPKD